MAIKTDSAYAEIFASINPKGTTLQEKRQWCVAAHGPQRYGATPEDDGDLRGYHKFAFHIDQVVEIALHHGFTSEAILAACCGHDVLEDTKKTILDLLCAGFTAEEVSMIWACTDGVGTTRAEKKAEAYRKILLVENAVVVKLCDRIANVEHGLRTGFPRKYFLYRDEHAHFEKTLRDPNRAETEPMWNYLTWLFSDEAFHLLSGTLDCCTEVRN